MTLKIPNCLQKAYKRPCLAKIEIWKEDVSAVIGYKQADGSVVGMVSASQLEVPLNKLQMLANLVKTGKY